MSHAKSDSFTSFPTWIPFISSSSLIATTRTSKTMLNKSGRSTHPCLVPYLWREAFNCSPLSVILAVDFPHMAFVFLRYVLSVHSFWRVFLS